MPVGVGSDDVVLSSRRLLWGRRRIGRAVLWAAVAIAAGVVLGILTRGALDFLLSAVAAGVLLALVFVAWVIVLDWVVLTPEGVRVHTGLSSRMFRPGLDLAAVRVTADDGILTAGTSTLYLKQGHRRGAIHLPLEDQERILDILDVYPAEVHQTRYGLGPGLSASERLVLPLYLRRPVATALMIAAVGVPAIIALVVVWADHAGAVEHDEANARLKTIEARVDAAGWRPHTKWKDWSDSSEGSTAWEREYEVGYGTTTAFTADWARLFPKAPARDAPDCEQLDSSWSCDAGTDVRVHGHPVRIDIEFDQESATAGYLQIVVSDDPDDG